ncbi:dienelactone hydrolase [Sporomusaceae bacterium BoRhaA]|uniref:dienelactone hydrolase family protein n=1 Tax=Pelorhabdus rhamnosifermentans TaxID=2772457 RepID=UPI001C061FC4|nr:dienelactone hydrolase family protein [Pelorhabdus rhamnosifermentans]MBU2700530.1 dienelactone hydrolase [Pelorhabdus rhamnosifermentans]
MLNYIHHADTVIIVLHEIYGVNQHIIDICEEFSKCGMDVIAPNLLKDKESFRYDQEAIAYQHFMNNIGFGSAFDQVKRVLYNVRASYKAVYVVGYSVGATLAWLCSETGLCDLAIGFYGSRIRDYFTRKPKCPVLLLFPTEEKTFDVDDLISHLSNFEHIQVEKLAGQHGFANPFSASYNKESAIKSCRKIMSFVKKYERGMSKPRRNW